MNYPDLETCKAIGGEFEDSEFVYGDTRFDMVNEIEIRDEIDTETYSICPAPTCEELGEWLWNENAMVTRSSRTPSFWRLHTPVLDDIEEFAADNETQARAEAVKLILKEQ